METQRKQVWDSIQVRHQRSKEQVVKMQLTYHRSKRSRRKIKSHLESTNRAQDLNSDHQQWQRGLARLNKVQPRAQRRMKHFLGQNHLQRLLTRRRSLTMQVLSSLHNLAIVFWQRIQVKIQNHLSPYTIIRRLEDKAKEQFHRAMTPAEHQESLNRCHNRHNIQY